MQHHKCGFIQCHLCNEQVRPAQHLCYMSQPKDKKQIKAPSFIFFDFESTQVCFGKVKLKPCLINGICRKRRCPKARSSTR